MPIEEVENDEGRSNNAMDVSGQFYGGPQDKASHHISGGDPNNEGTNMDFDEAE